MVQMSTVWDRTTAFVSAAVGAILPIAVLLLFLPISIDLAIRPILARSGMEVRLIVLAVLWLIELFGTLALVALALDGAARASEAVRAALPRWLPAIGVFVVLVIAAGLLAVPMGLGVAWSGIDMAALRAGSASPDHISPGGALFIVLYAIVYFIVLLWLSARLMTIMPVVFAERRGLGAIPRAFTMTRGLSWRLVGVLLLYVIVSTVAVLAAETVFGSILKLIAPDDGDIGIASVLTSIIVGAVSAGFKVFAAVFTAKLYVAIRTQAEGFAEPS